jgi:hypothetical protein
MSLRSGDELEDPLTLTVGETVEFRDFSSDQPRRAVITSVGKWHASIRLEGEEGELQVPPNVLRRAQ